MIHLVKIAGWVMSKLPDPLVAAFCHLAGFVWRLIMPGRYRTAVKNLSLTFPDEGSTWSHRTIRVSFARTIEMALFTIVSPFWSDKEFRRRLIFSEGTWEYVKEWSENPRPRIFLVPHYCLTEMIPHVSTVLGGYDIGEVGAIFRPLNQPSLDKWLKETRARHGFRLLSRKKGFQEARRILRNNGNIAVLFDQRAGGTGTLIMSMDRVTSATELPALLAKESVADVYLVISKRRALFKSVIEVTKIPEYSQPEDITILGNQALDQYITSHKEIAADWLWVHDRWRTHHKTSQRLSLEHKRSLLDRQKEILQWKNLPRKTKIWIRMPFDFEDFIPSLFFVRAVTEGRPDAAISLIGPAYGEWICENLDLGVDYLRLKIPFAKKLAQHVSWKSLHPDTVIVLQKGQKTAVETRALGCSHTVGMDCFEGSSLLHQAVPVNNVSEDDVNLRTRFDRHRQLGKSMGLKDGLFNLEPMVFPTEPESDRCENAYILLSDYDQECAIGDHLRELFPGINLFSFRFLKPEPVPTSLLWPEIFINFRHRHPAIISDQLSWVLIGRAFDLPVIHINMEEEGSQARDIIAEYSKMESSASNPEIPSIPYHQKTTEELADQIGQLLKSSRNRADLTGDSTPTRSGKSQPA